mgnify:CR=1 FL=1
MDPGGLIYYYKRGFAGEKGTMRLFYVGGLLQGLQYVAFAVRNNRMLEIMLDRFGT